jgi:hypothetical protein
MRVHVSQEAVTAEIVATEEIVLHVTKTDLIIQSANALLTKAIAAAMVDEVDSLRKISQSQSQSSVITNVLSVILNAHNVMIVLHAQVIVQRLDRGNRMIALFVPSAHQHVLRLVQLHDLKHALPAMIVHHALRAQNVLILIHAIALQRRSGLHKKSAIQSVLHVMIAPKEATVQLRNQLQLNLSAQISSILWPQSQQMGSVQSQQLRKLARRLHLRHQSLAVQENLQ